LKSIKEKKRPKQQNGPAAATVGGCEKQDEQNLLGGSPSDGVNVTAGMGRPPVTVEIAWRRVIAQSSMRDSNIQRFAQTSAKAKTWFSM
jgi:hypothetical protein